MARTTIIAGGRPFLDEDDMVSNSAVHVASQQSIKAYTDSKLTIAQVVYTDQSGGTSDTYGVLAGAIDGSNKVFTVSQAKYVSATLQVYLNGQLQTQGTAEDWTETTPTSGTFTFVTAPAPGDLISVTYQISAIAGGRSVVSKTTTYTAVGQDDIILCDATSAAFTVTLPTAVGIIGKTLQVKKIDSSANAVTIDGNASETIRVQETAATTQLLYVQGDFLEIVSDGANWECIIDGLIPHQAKLTRDVAQAISTGIVTKIAFDTSAFDVGGIGDITTNDRVDIKRTGKYLVSTNWSVISVLDLAEDVWVAYYVNGVVQRWFTAQSTATNESVSAIISEVINLTAGDYVEMYVLQTEGASYNTSTALNYKPIMAVIEVR